MASPLEQRGQLAPVRHVARPAAAVLGRMTAIGSSLPNRLGDHGARMDDDAIGDVEVSHVTGGTSYHSLTSYTRAAVDSGSAGDSSVRANVHSVPDLEKSVQLDAALTH